MRQIRQLTIVSFGCTLSIRLKKTDIVCKNKRTRRWRSLVRHKAVVVACNTQALRASTDKASSLAIYTYCNNILSKTCPASVPDEFTVNRVASARLQPQPPFFPYTSLAVHSCHLLLHSLICFPVAIHNVGAAAILRHWTRRLFRPCVVYFLLLQAR